MEPKEQFWPINRRQIGPSNHPRRGEKIVYRAFVSVFFRGFWREKWPVWKTLACDRGC